MVVWQWISYGVLLTAHVQLVVGYGHPNKPACIHDHPHIQTMQAELLRVNPAVEEPHGLLAEKAVGPIRIVVDTLTMTTPGKYCQRVSQSVPTFKGDEFISCTTDTVLTDAKRRRLTNTVIPRAISRLRGLIDVAQYVGPMKISEKLSCGSVEIPSFHRTVGVSDADVVIYAAAGPTESSVAFAFPCGYLASGRFAVGVINFNPKYFDPSDDVDYQVNVATHEMLHVLGVTGSKLKLNSISVRKRGKTVVYNTLPPVVDWVRRYTGCASLEGGELEDEGTSGSPGSHWEAKVWHDETMMPTGGGSVSGLSLAFLAGLNEGYSIKRSEPMHWGRAWGCGIHNYRCNTVAGGRGRYYCFDEDAVSCTSDFKGYGPCWLTTHSEALPSSFQYFNDPRKGGFTFMDGCPIYEAWSNRDCTEARSATALEASSGHVFQSNSRCYETKSGGNTHRCMATRCDAQSGVLTVAMGASSFYRCPSGDSVQLQPEWADGFSGTVYCPANEDMCSTFSTETVPIASPGISSPTASSTTKLSRAATATVSPSLVATLLFVALACLYPT